MRVVFVGRQRQLWRIAVLYIVTFGIARRLWLHRVNREVDGHAGLGLDHRGTVALLCLPIIGPAIVTFQTAYRLNLYLQTEMKLAYGPTWALGLTSLVPIAGPMFFQLWTQDRLNQYWEVEKDNKRHAIDITQGLDKDTAFQKKVEAARAASRKAGSRTPSRWDRARAKLATSGESLASVAEERRQVRAAGGSTPLLPWRRPQRPPRTRLHVVCGQCDMEFEVERDPVAETPIICVKCGQQEILPSLRGDELKPQAEHVVVAAMTVDCPQCETQFHALRNLHGPTKIKCYNCGKSGSIPAPSKTKVAASS